MTDGPERAPARAMLHAIGFSAEDLARPIIGVGHSWIETMPCNYNHRRLAEHVKAGIRAAGATPMEFNTIAVSDGVSMGTEGMRASLVSREVIADSIELVARGHSFDGLVLIVLAVNWPPHAPAPGHADSSTARSSASSTRPAAYAPTTSNTSWRVMSAPR